MKQLLSLISLIAEKQFPVSLQYLFLFFSFIHQQLIFFFRELLIN